MFHTCGYTTPLGHQTNQRFIVRLSCPVHARRKIQLKVDGEGKVLHCVDECTDCKKNRPSACIVCQPVLGVKP